MLCEFHLRKYFVQKFRKKYVRFSAKAPRLNPAQLAGFLTPSLVPPPFTEPLCPSLGSSIVPCFLPCGGICPSFLTLSGSGMPEELPLGTEVMPVRPILPKLFASLFLDVETDTLLWFPISYIGWYKNMPF